MTEAPVHTPPLEATAERLAPGDSGPPLNAAAVLAAVFLIATCGLIYELIAGTLASYVLGDSVTQFSTVIGVYLSAMGLGAWLSKFIGSGVVVRFVEIESAVALVGGTSAAFLFLAYSHLSFFHPLLYGTVLLIGTLVGLEIPLLMRILKDTYELKDLIARVLTVDYLGALVASLAFPMFLVPKLGLVRGALAVGILNALVAIWSTYLFARIVHRPARLVLLRVEAFFVLILLLVGMVFADELTALSEDEMYPDPIVFAETSPYQRIVFTRSGSQFQLFLSSHLQFASGDEHRYHEALVHPGASVAAGLGAPLERVLVLGGGDGLAVREILKHDSVRKVLLVDLDPVMTTLARDFPLLAELNQRSLHDPRVRVTNADAMTWLASGAEAEGRFDLIIIDFPDPNSFSLGKLYTTRFYRLVQRVLAENGALVVQATSPLIARRSYWCVVRTISASGLHVQPYHANVPSFGEWGFVLAARRPFDPPSELPDLELRFLTERTMASLFDFPRDMSEVETEVNRLNNQILVQYYGAEWSRWY